MSVQALSISVEEMKSAVTGCLEDFQRWVVSKFHFPFETVPPHTSSCTGDRT